VDVVGVSKDTPAALARWKDKLALPFTLLSDPDAEVQKASDVWKEKNMYGNKVMGTERTTVVIDADGKVEQVFRKVKVEGHVGEVIAAL
jgi:peroxiredoxin Q/BCP